MVTILNKNLPKQSLSNISVQTNLDANMLISLLNDHKKAMDYGANLGLVGKEKVVFAIREVMNSHYAGTDIKVYAITPDGNFVS